MSRSHFFKDNEIKYLLADRDRERISNLKALVANIICGYQGQCEELKWQKQTSWCRISSKIIDKKIKEYNELIVKNQKNLAAFEKMLDDKLLTEEEKQHLLLTFENHPSIVNYPTLAKTEVQHVAKKQ